jgi:hypothetical protein
MHEVKALTFPTDTSKVDKFIREARNILAVHKQSNPLESEIMKIRDEFVRQVPYNTGKQWVKRITAVY